MKYWHSKGKPKNTTPYRIIRGAPQRLWQRWPECPPDAVGRETVSGLRPPTISLITAKSGHFYLAKKPDISTLP
jgi:hypothetical protein